MNKNNRKRIASAGPSITESEVELVTEAARIGWYENRNMHIDQLIKEFSSYTEMKYCLPVINCTSAIHLALLSLKIGPGDEVIVPDISWVASACPIVYVGATPVFVDIDRKNWCISSGSFEKAITEKTKAVVVVDLYGNMPEMNDIIKIARLHNIPVIEDAAEAIGAEYRGKKAGTFGEIGVFSFNATKLAIAGQGGILVTNDMEIFEKCKKLRHHGMSDYQTKMYWSDELGYNYQWTNIQAALALAQLRRINDLIDKKRQAYEWYYSRLHSVDDIQLSAEEKHVKGTFWIVNAILGDTYNITKEDIVQEFNNHGIDSRPFFYPISSMPPYSRYVSGRNMIMENPVSYTISPRGISFPASFALTEEDVDYVCDIFLQFISKNRKH
jgi:perosamine synthetase